MLSNADRIIPGILLQPSNRVLRHLLIQLIVLLISINVLWDEPIRILPARLGVWALYFLMLDAVIYTNMYLLVPRLLIRGRAWIYILFTTLLILCMIFSLGMLQDSADDAISSIHPPVAIGLGSGLFAFGLFIIGLTSLQLLKYRMENAGKISALQHVTMEIELANLQNQINPHFLFNMLNNANIMAGEDGKKSAYILSKLNDLLYYQVEGGSKETVRLRDDIDFLRDYLELEALRRDRFQYDIHLEGDDTISVPPLLFVPFVENAVKHNPENDSFVDIRFSIVERTVYFECRNPKAQAMQWREDGGIGLENIRRRLDLLFGVGYQLTLKDEKDLYTVIMKLDI